MTIKHLKFRVDYCKDMVNIDTLKMNTPNSFSYANILGMYNTPSTQGRGIQVNAPQFEKAYTKMCDKISQAIYDCIKEIENEDS